MLLPRVHYISSLFYLEDKDNAIKEMKNIMSLNNPSIIAIELFKTICDNMDINDAIEFYQTINEKDERVYTAIAYLYVKLLQKYENYSLVSDINICFRNIKILNSKYILPAYIEREMYKAISHQNEEIIAKSIADSVISDYYMPLIVARSYVRKNNINKVIEYYELFIKRFKEFHYKNLVIDFLSFHIDIDEVNNISHELLEFLSETGKNIEYSKQELDSLFRIELNEYYNIDNMVKFDNGDMPLKNLFYRERIVVPEGTLVVR